ncbi:MAG: chemotaxis protein CheW [Sphingobacteriia bacterium]|nr:chemotaxis protein CheW [Sphingobacteriia bacterium]
MKQYLCKEKEKEDFLTIEINGSIFAISLSMVKDIIFLHNLTKVPLAPAEVLGLINLNGQIMPVLDITSKLNMQKVNSYNQKMSVVIESQQEIYSLLVDSVGDIISIPKGHIMNDPANFSIKLQEVVTGVYAFEEKIITILNIEKLFKKIIAANDVKNF